MTIRSTITVGQVSLLLLLTCASHGAMSQGTYPLAKGNLWQYWDRDYQNGQWFWIYGWTEEVIGDTLMPNGETYAVISSDRVGAEGVVKPYFLRQEGPMVILGYNQISPDSDYVVYDFSRTVGDTTNLDNAFVTIIAADDYNYFFGLWRRYQDYLMLSLTSSAYLMRRVVDGFGVVYFEGEAGITFYLRGTIIDNVSYGTIASVENERPMVPASFQLEQNYPNPFNPSTTIGYALPERSHVTLTVFNTLGQQVAMLVEGEMEAGYHEVKFDASDLSSGVYLYQLRAGAYVETRKLIHVK